MAMNIKRGPLSVQYRPPMQLGQGEWLMNIPILPMASGTMLNVLNGVFPY